MIYKIFFPFHVHKGEVLKCKFVYSSMENSGSDMAKGSLKTEIMKFSVSCFTCLWWKFNGTKGREKDGCRNKVLNVGSL